jgi:hypothetical protein
LKLQNFIPIDTNYTRNVKALKLQPPKERRKENKKLSREEKKKQTKGCPNSESPTIQ